MTDSTYPGSVAESLARRWLAMFNTGDFTQAEQLASATFVEHAIAPFGTQEPGPVPGPAHLREAGEWLKAQFPDLRMTIEASLATSHLVAIRVAASGTNLGPLNGVIPPTGRRFEARQTHWFQVDDERLSEHWATRDDLAVMIQLGLVAPPGRR